MNKKIYPETRFGTPKTLEEFKQHCEWERDIEHINILNKQIKLLKRNIKRDKLILFCIKWFMLVPIGLITVLKILVSLKFLF